MNGLGSWSLIPCGENSQYLDPISLDQLPTCRSEIPLSLQVSSEPLGWAISRKLHLDRKISAMENLDLPKLSCPE